MNKRFISFLILGLTALSSPVRADDNPPQMDQPEVTKNGSYEISGNWSELKRAWNTLTLKITDRNKQPVTGAKVTVVYDMVDMPMTPPERPVVEKGDGVYEKRVFPGMRGDWQFDTTVEKDNAKDTHIKIQNIKN